jgi:hypothetical protein
MREMGFADPVMDGTIRLLGRTSEEHFVSVAVTTEGLP